MRELAERDYYGLIGTASFLAESDNTEHLDEAMELLEMAEPMKGAAHTKNTEALLYHIMGTVRWNQGREEEAVAFFEKSKNIWPHPDNLAVQRLEELGR